MGAPPQASFARGEVGSAEARMLREEEIDRGTPNITVTRPRAAPCLVDIEWRMMIVVPAHMITGSCRD